MNNYRTTFINGDQEHVNRGAEHLSRVIDCLTFYMDWGTDSDSFEYTFKDRFNCDLDEFNDYLERYPKTAHFHIHRDLVLDFDEIAEAKEVINTQYDLSDFYNYGLSFDFCEADEENDGYYRFQLSWGGPSDEIRFYHDGSIEYVFLDWFVGVGFDVSYEDSMKWVCDWFKEVQSIDWDSIPYEEIYQIEEEECEEDY